VYWIWRSDVKGAISVDRGVSQQLKKGEINGVIFMVGVRKASGYTGAPVTLRMKWITSLSGCTN